ncbi:oligopeptide ABC transporter substrate-binding protein [Lactobacillus psittaci]|uniref:Oligopeptide ABC transporter substrate n=1 Tax=Lactobacillus psittaci DSM 15354 TaxID=1122152 RepID=A0A0R1SDH8_9LACO|nr:oligopeptide ABC transporter substrate-binding protein [Lactobacillus psittaci]KRL63992.1 oligopeptide ABC transporter substrate [Lactobacillus psittaci DSM 15354]
MNKTRVLSSFGLLAGVALTLTACGSKSSNTNSQNTTKFKTAVPTKAAKSGGTLNYAIEADSPFTGIFSNELETSATDSDVMQFGNESLFDTDDNYKINNNGPATFKLDKNAKTVTIKIKKGVKWSDGKQVVAKDIEYAYEIIANKDTKSQRYTSSLANIEGLAEYHSGKASSISGIEMPKGENGDTVVLHFKEMKPGMYQSGNGYFWESAAPYHYLKDVKFKDLESSDKIRKHPLFFGPYKLQKLVRGQSATWVRNPYYWRGTPKLNKIVATVVGTSAVSQAIKSHKFDMIGVINSQWKNVKDTKNVNFIAKVPLSYSYLGFKVGKYDSKTGKNVMNKNAKMNNKALRQAIAYGMNVDEAYKRYMNGLSFRVPTLIPKQFGKFYNSNADAYSYNLKKGNEILDKAGFKKKGTYRTLPNGKKLTIHLAAMSGSSVQETIVQNYIQQWKKLGLNVKLTTGRLIEFNSFYDKVQNDSKDIDMFIGAWSLSSEPSPADLYSETAPFNFSRFVSKENTKLLDDIDSQKSFNTAYRVKAFHKWQKYMNDQAYVVPVSNGYSITAVNSKLTNVNLNPSSGNSLWYKVAFVK